MVSPKWHKLITCSGSLHWQCQQTLNSGAFSAFNWQWVPMFMDTLKKNLSVAVLQNNINLKYVLLLKHFWNCQHLANNSECLGHNSPWSTWNDFQSCRSSLNSSETSHCFCFICGLGHRLLSSLQPAYCYSVCWHTGNINWYLTPVKYIL